MVNKPAHITTGNVLDDLGFTPEEATALKIKSELLDAILDEIAVRQYTSRQLIALLDEYQPQISNLRRGKISSISMEKLLQYCDRLGLRAQVMIQRSGWDRKPLMDAKVTNARRGYVTFRAKDGKAITVGGTREVGPVAGLSHWRVSASRTGERTAAIGARTAKK